MFVLFRGRRSHRRAPLRSAILEKPECRGEGGGRDSQEDVEPYRWQAFHRVTDSLNGGAMTRTSVRLTGVILSLAVAAIAIVVLWPGDAESGLPDLGLADAQKLLECGPGEGVFAYNASWSDGPGFATAEEALKAILVGKDFGFTSSDFEAMNLARSDPAVTEFTVDSGGSKTAVVWVQEYKKGWLADSVYGCTKLAE